MPDIVAVHKHSTAYRRMSIRGRNGRVYTYLVQSALPKHARGEERIGQLLRSLSSMLDRRPESRQRGLHFAVARMVPLNTHVRLVQEDPTTFSLEDVLSEHCAAKGISIDAPVTYSYEARKQDMITRANTVRVCMRLFVFTFYIFVCIYIYMYIYIYVRLFVCFYALYIV